MGGSGTAPDGVGARLNQYNAIAKAFDERGYVRSEAKDVSKHPFAVIDTPRDQRQFRLLATQPVDNHAETCYLESVTIIVTRCLQLNNPSETTPYRNAWVVDLVKRATHPDLAATPMPEPLNFALPLAQGTKEVSHTTRKRLAIEQEGECWLCEEKLTSLRPPTDGLTTAEARHCCITSNLHGELSHLAPECVLIHARCAQALANERRRKCGGSIGDWTEERLGEFRAKLTREVSRIVDDSGNYREETFRKLQSDDRVQSFCAKVASQNGVCGCYQPPFPIPTPAEYGKAKNKTIGAWWILTGQVDDLVEYLGGARVCSKCGNMRAHDVQRKKAQTAAEFVASVRGGTRAGTLVEQKADAKRRGLEAQGDLCPLCGLDLGKDRGGKAVGKIPAFITLNGSAWVSAGGYVHMICYNWFEQKRKTGHPDYSYSTNRNVRLTEASTIVQAVQNHGPALAEKVQRYL